MPSSGHENVVLEGHGGLNESLLNIFFLVWHRMVSRMRSRDTCSLQIPPYFMTMAFFITCILSFRFEELFYLKGTKDHLILFQSHTPSYVSSRDAFLINSFHSLRNWRGWRVWACCKVFKQGGMGVLYLLLLQSLYAAGQR